MENQEIKNILKSRRDGIQNVKKVDEDAVFEGVITSYSIHYTKLYEKIKKEKDIKSLYV